jgi:hypothetical protein
VSLGRYVPSVPTPDTQSVVDNHNSYSQIQGRDAWWVSRLILFRVLKSSGFMLPVIMSRDTTFSGSSSRHSLEFEVK